VIDAAQLFTGDLNRQALGDAWALPSGPVGMYDTTLRDGEQATGVSLSAESKVEIAHALDRLGVDRIEASFPRVSAEDAEATKVIVNAGLSAEIWGFARAMREDVDALLECGVQSTIIEAPVSDRKLGAYRMSRETVCQRITDAVTHAVSAGMRVCFFGVDGTRADLQFLEDVYRRAIDVGAGEIAVVDTIGVLNPEAAALLVERVCRRVGPEIPVHWHGHNDFGLATAASIAAVRAGASWVQGTVNGMGERAGNTVIGEVAMALDALYGISTRLRHEHVREVSKLVQEHSGYTLDPWKPITGRDIFTRESGAVASQFDDPSAIEPYAAELVGAKLRAVLGKKSGLDSIRVKAAEFGIEVDRDRWPALLAEVKRLGSERHGLVSDDEFRALVASDIGGS
jgi:isopropylmalate/homocitrate/citramalate synthase